MTYDDIIVGGGYGRCGAGGAAVGGSGPPGPAAGGGPGLGDPCGLEPGDLRDGWRMSLAGARLGADRGGACPAGHSGIRVGEVIGGCHPRSTPRSRCAACRPTTTSGRRWATTSGRWAEGAAVLASAGRRSGGGSAGCTGAAGPGSRFAVGGAEELIPITARLLSRCAAASASPEVADHNHPRQPGWARSRKTGGAACACRRRSPTCCPRGSRTT